MAANQDNIANLNKLIDEIMRKSVEAVEEVQLEPQPVEGINVEQGTQPEEEEQAVTQGPTKEEKEPGNFPIMFSICTFPNFNTNPL